jgi:hypothetical protein
MECTIYYSCDDKQHIFGRGFIISKRIRSRVIDFKPIDRKCVCSELEKNLNTTVTSAFMHLQKKRGTERRSSFMMQLEKIYKKCPSYDTKIILGDTNAKVKRKLGLGQL